MKCPGESSEKIRKLEQRMFSLGIFEQDLEEKFVHSSGPGGQNVNKLATCVDLCHRPTGIRVKCQKQREQGVNRYLARMALLDAIEQRRRESELREISRREKLRRQTRKRSWASKQKMLADKKIHSRRKEERRKTQIYAD